MNEIQVLKEYVAKGELTLEQAQEMLRLRYSNTDEVPMEADTKGFTPFGFKVEMLTDKAQKFINGERQVFSALGTHIFLNHAHYEKNGILRLVLFTNDGEGNWSEDMLEIKEFYGDMIYWHPSNDNYLMWFDRNDCWIYDVRTNTRKLYDTQPVSFTGSGQKVAGGDGNNPDFMTGKMVVGDKDQDMYVYDINNRTASKTFRFSQLDYARYWGDRVVFIGDGKGTFIFDHKTGITKQLYRRGNHTGFVYLHGNLPGIVVDLNEVDSRTYGTDPFVEAVIDYEGDVHQLGETFPTPAPAGIQSGQYSAGGWRIFKALHGPAKYNKGWGPRHGEVIELDPNEKGIRRIARHGIGYTSSYSASYQPEVVALTTHTAYKGPDGWYKVEVPVRALDHEVDAFIAGIDITDPVINPDPLPDPDPIVIEDPSQDPSPQLDLIQEVEDLKEGYQKLNEGIVMNSLKISEVFQKLSLTIEILEKQVFVLNQKLEGKADPSVDVNQAMKDILRRLSDSL